MLWWLIKVHWPYFILTQLLVNWLLEDITLQWSLGDSELVNDLPISTPDVMGIYRHWHPPNATHPPKSKALLRDSEGIMVVNKPNIKPANFPGRVAYWYRHRCSWVFSWAQKGKSVTSKVKLNQSQILFNMCLAKRTHCWHEVFHCFTVSPKRMSFLFAGVGCLSMLVYAWLL